MEFLFSCGIVFTTLWDNECSLGSNSNKWLCLRKSHLKDCVEDQWNPADLLHQFEHPLIWYLKQQHTQANEQNIALLLKHGDYEFNAFSSYLRHSPDSKRFKFVSNNTVIFYDTLLTLIARNEHYYALHWILDHNDNLTVDFNQIEAIHGETILHVLAHRCADFALLKRIITETNITTTTISKLKYKQTYYAILGHCSNASIILQKLSDMENAFRDGLVSAIWRSDNATALRFISKIVYINQQFGIRIAASNTILWTNPLKLALSQQNPCPIIIRALLDHPFISYSLNEAVVSFSLVKDANGFKNALTKYLKADANVINAADSFGNTPLMVSMWYPFYFHDIIDIILSIPILDVNVVNGEGWNALEVAIKTADLELIRKVISHRSLIRKVMSHQSPNTYCGNGIILWMKQSQIPEHLINFVYSTIRAKIVPIHAHPCQAMRLQLLGRKTKSD